jgi:mRNA interferase MazF
MPSTTIYKQGDIVLVSFPFTDLTSAKKRPALVISPDSFNAVTEDLMLAERGRDEFPIQAASTGW